MRNALIIGISVILLIFLFLFVYPQPWSEKYLNRPFRLGLDLVGGAHLVYEADLSTVASQDKASSMEGIRDVIERRVNLYGVQEPVVQVTGENRLSIELAGVRDISEAIKLIGETPFLEFRELKGKLKEGEESEFVPTGLSGKHLKTAQLAFDPNTGIPQIDLEFNDEGAQLFLEITQRNVGKFLAIYLDGQPISIPRVNEEIPGGRAVISGQFTIPEARELALRLKTGALPVPINPVSQESVGASLGKESLDKSLKAGLVGLALVAGYMIIFYRLPGLISVLSLIVYSILVLSLYKLVPVTLTLAGVAGIILSLGMAVDANILIFSRIREELKSGKNLLPALDSGFHRAWLAIRDSQVTTLISAVILYMFSTSLVKGFALTLGLGTLISIFTAITVTKFMMGLMLKESLAKWKWLF